MHLKYLTEDNNIKIPKRSLGKTDIQATIIGLGGQGSLEKQGPIRNCIKIIERAIELGINWADTSPVYGNGKSEKAYGEALKGIRKNIILATKTDDRTRDGSLKKLEGSLKRLKTDYIDLWQLHHLENSTTIKEIMSKDGALKALIEMKEQGVVKHLGITGHEHPDVLMEMMDEYPFDTVLCPINAADRHMNKPFIDTAVRKAKRKGMGIIGMKIFSQGYIFHPQGLISPWEALTYALSQGASTLIIGIDTVEQLEENVSIAKSFVEMTRSQKASAEAKTEKSVRRGCFFRKEYGGYNSQEKLHPPYTTSGK